MKTFEEWLEKNDELFCVTNVGQYQDISEEAWNAAQAECAKRCIEIVGQRELAIEPALEIAKTIIKEFKLDECL